MKFRNQFLKYKLQSMAEEGESGGGQGEGAPSGEGEQGEGGEAQPDVKELMAEVERLRNHTNELLGEKKREAEKRRQAEEEAQRKEQERLLQNKDFEQLHASSEKERERIAGELNQLRETIANEKRDSAALKLATELADGDNIDLLGTFISQRLRMTDDGLKVTDQNGNLTVSTLDDLKNEFKNSARFASLIRGSQAAGGGATGGKQGGGAAKELTRQEFEALPPNERRDFFKSGGQIV